MAKRTIKVGDKEYMAEEVPFETEREEWNRYILHDGTALKIKTVLAEVVRLEGLYNPQTGDPVYMVNASPVVSTTVPDSLKKKAE